MVLKELMEMIRRRLAEGDPTINDAVQDPELKRAIIAACAEGLKREALAINYNLDGASIPAGGMIATYEGEFAVTLTRGSGQNCRAQLPCAPMQMPEDIGVFSVYPSGRPEAELIPLRPGHYNLWVGVPLLSDFMEVLYAPYQDYIEIYADLIGRGITTVDMRIITTDIQLIGEYSQLPIGADMVLPVMERVLKLYMPPGAGEDGGGYNKELNTTTQQPQQ